MQVTVRAQYSAGTENIVDLPVDNWEEVKEWFIKWGVFHYTLDGKEWTQVDADNGDLEVDTKRPDCVEIISTFDGEILDEQ